MPPRSAPRRSAPSNRAASSSASRKLQLLKVAGRKSHLRRSACEKSRRASVAFRKSRPGIVAFMSKVSSNRISNALTSVKAAPVNLHPTTFAPSRLLRLSVTLLKSLLVKDASDRSQPANEAKAARHDRHVERYSFAP